MTLSPPRSRTDAAREDALQSSIDGVADVDLQAIEGYCGIGNSPSNNGGRSKCLSWDSERNGSKCSSSNTEDRQNGSKMGSWDAAEDQGGLKTGHEDGASADTPHWVSGLRDILHRIEGKLKHLERSIGQERRAGGGAGSGAGTPKLRRSPSVPLWLSEEDHHEPAKLPRSLSASRWVSEEERRSPARLRRSPSDIRWRRESDEDNGTASHKLGRSCSATFQAPSVQDHSRSASKCSGGSRMPDRLVDPCRSQSPSRSSHQGGQGPCSSQLGNPAYPVLQRPVPDIVRKPSPDPPLSFTRKISPESVASSAQQPHKVSFAVMGVNVSSYTSSEAESIEKRKISFDSSGTASYPVASQNTVGSGEQPQAWPGNIELRKEFLNSAQRVGSRVTVAQLMHSRHASMTGTFDPPDFLDAYGGRWQPLVLDPESRVHQVHEFFAFLAMFFDWAIMPYVVAWEVPFSGFLEVCGWLSVVVWSVDLALGFFTGTYKDGELELRLPKIAKRYLRKWFLPNCLALVGDLLSLVQVMEWRRRRSLRVVSLVRLFRLTWLFDGLMDRSLADRRRMLLQGLKLFIAVLWLNHVICCVWYIIGVRGPTDTGDRWIDTLEAVHSTSGMRGYEELGSLYHYFTAFHWTISQLTSGGLEHIAPLNTLERIFNIFCVIFGLIFMTSLVSLLSATMTQFFIQKQDQVQKLRELRIWLVQKSVTQRMALRVVRQVAERLSRKKKLTDQDVPALALLSSNLRAELRYELLQPTILKHSLLRLCDRVDLETVQSLCGEGVDFRLVSPGDNLFEFGQQAKEGMYFVSHGKLRYILKSVYALRHFDTAEEVGEGSWLCEAALWTNWAHTGTAQATVPCELQVFESEKTLSILFKHSTIKDLVSEYSRHFHQRVVLAVPPVTPPPTDLRVPFTQYEDIVMAMGKEAQTMISELALCEAEAQGALDNKAISRLKAEVGDGDATIVSNELGEVERALGWSQLRLERSDDGFLLVHLGRCDNNGGAVPHVQFPGTKQHRGELPTDAVHRVLGELAQLVSEVVVDDFNRDCYLKEPAAGIDLPTKFLRTTFTAHMDSIYEPKGQVQHMKSEAGHSSFVGKSESMLQADRKAEKFAEQYEVYKITEGAASGGLYTWVPALDFRSLCDAAEGTRIVESWLLKLEEVTAIVSDVDGAARRQKNRTSDGSRKSKSKSSDSLKPGRGRRGSLMPQALAPFARRLSATPQMMTRSRGESADSEGMRQGTTPVPPSSRRPSALQQLQLLRLPGQSQTDLQVKDSTQQGRRASLMSSIFRRRTSKPLRSLVNEEGEVSTPQPAGRMEELVESLTEEMAATEAGTGNGKAMFSNVLPSAAMQDSPSSTKLAPPPPAIAGGPASSATLGIPGTISTDSSRS